MSALEERYQVDLSETSFASASTLGEIGKLLQNPAIETNRYHYPRWTLRWPVTWIRIIAYYLLVRPAIVLMGWPTILGRNNLANVRGPVLVVSNHIDHVDVGFIQTALPARLRHHLATATGGEALEALRNPSNDRGIWRKLLSARSGPSESPSKSLPAFERLGVYRTGRPDSYLNLPGPSELLPNILRFQTVHQCAWGPRVYRDFSPAIPLRFETD